jgi:hypothetical protein
VALKLDSSGWLVPSCLVSFNGNIPTLGGIQLPSPSWSASPATGTGCYRSGIILFLIFSKGLHNAKCVLV